MEDLSHKDPAEIEKELEEEAQKEWEKEKKGKFNRFVIDGAFITGLITNSPGCDYILGINRAGFKHKASDNKPSTKAVNSAFKAAAVEWPQIFEEWLVSFEKIYKKNFKVNEINIEHFNFRGVGGRKQEDLQQEIRAQIIEELPSYDPADYSDYSSVDYIFGSLTWPVVKKINNNFGFAVIVYLILALNNMFFHMYNSAKHAINSEYEKAQRKKRPYVKKVLTKSRHEKEKVETREEGCPECGGEDLTKINKYKHGMTSSEEVICNNCGYEGKASKPFYWKAKLKEITTHNVYPFSSKQEKAPLNVNPASYAGSAEKDPKDSPQHELGSYAVDITGRKVKPSPNAGSADFAGNSWHALTEWISFKEEKEKYDLTDSQEKLLKELRKSLREEPCKKLDDPDKARKNDSGGTEKNEKYGGNFGRDCSVLQAIDLINYEQEHENFDRTKDGCGRKAQKPGHLRRVKGKCFNINYNGKVEGKSEPVKICENVYNKDYANKHEKVKREFEKLKQKILAEKSKNVEKNMYYYNEEGEGQKVFS